MVIDLEGVSVRFDTQLVLDGVSVHFRGGSAGLLGPNGAGKTTLIKTVLGFVRPIAGSGRILGFDIRNQQLKIRQKIGYMPETDCHIPGMTAVTYVAYAGQLAGMRPKDALQRAHEILYYVGLGEARYRPVETYSTGMKQRIKLAQALVHDPELLLLDEPTNGLDPKGRIEMLDLIRDVTTSKSIHVILSSHLLPDVEWVCRDAVVIHRGRILADGSIADLKRGDGRIYEVRIKGEAGGFLQALTAGGCQCSPGDDGLLRVQLGEGSDSLVIVRAARDQNVQIRHMVPMRKSLEDAFMQVIGGGNAHL